MNTNNKKPNPGSFIPYLVAIAFLAALFFTNPLSTGTTSFIDYTKLNEILETGSIKEANLTVDDNIITVTGVYEENGVSKAFSTDIPKTETSVDEVINKLKEANAQITISDANESSFLISILSMPL